MSNRIRELREKLGWSQATLGERVGAHWQTVQRAESGRTTLSEKKQKRYAEALGVAVGELFKADQAREVVVKGFVQAGVFAETWELPREDQYSVLIPPDPSLQDLTLHAAEVRGESMNRRYQEGTVLIFTDMIESYEDLIFGKRYIVERERADGLREATVKTLWRDPDGKAWLMPESTDLRFQAPIPLDGEENDTVRIVGRVRYSVGRE